MGTFLYAPPEQLFGSAQNPRDDVFALGVLAYQMVLPDLKAVPGTDAVDVLRDRAVPSDLAALIVRSVAMDPVRRPADAGEWERALAALSGAPAPDPQPISLPPEPEVESGATAED